MIEPRDQIGSPRKDLHPLVRNCEFLKELFQIIAEPSFEILRSRDITPHGINAGNRNQIFQNIERIHNSKSCRVAESIREGNVCRIAIIPQHERNSQDLA